MNLKQSRKRRALATVITSAIMMAAVTIMGGAGVVWSQTSLNSQQIEMSDTVDDYLNKINESLMFEYVYCNDDPCDTIIVVLTNVGNIGLDVSQITIYDKMSGFSKIHSMSKAQIMPDDSISVVINDSLFSSYSILDVSAITIRGNIIQTQITT
ncbi:MAG: hypothetical protein HQ505_00860 [Nitrosopumilus sp.]|nr:hypothetical protein [Nitrosopumilus sp.]